DLRLALESRCRAAGQLVRYLLCGALSVALFDQRLLLRRQSDRASGRYVKREFLDSNKRHQLRRKPDPELFFFAQGFRDRIDAPSFKVEVALGNKACAWTYPQVIVLSFEPRPADRTKEPDRIVLDAISLDVIGNQFFVLSRSRIARPRSAVASQQRRHSGVIRPTILPDDRFAKALRRCNLADSRRYTLCPRVVFARKLSSRLIHVATRTIERMKRVALRAFEAEPRRQSAFGDVAQDLTQRTAPVCFGALQLSANNLDRFAAGPLCLLHSIEKPIRGGCAFIAC